jgi:hypothetical protein
MMNALVDSCSYHVMTTTVNDDLSFTMLPTTEATYRYDDSSPFWGGDQIGASGQGGCSSGFAEYSSVDKTDGVLTAGHCFKTLGGSSTLEISRSLRDDRAVRRSGSRRRAVLAGAAALLVAACGSIHYGAVSNSSPSGYVLRHYQGAPPDAEAVPGPSGLGPLDASVWAGTSEIAVVAWGSSGCPRLPTSVDVTGNNTIEITMSEVAPSPGVTCTADAKPTTSILSIPADINAAQEVSVRIRDGDFSATVSLPPQKSG